MRIFIVAIDGLDYYLVKKWRLKNLLQTIHGTYNVSEFEKYDFLTPIIWTSFITGKRPEEHGVLYWWSWGDFLDRLKWKPPFKWVKGKRNFLKRIGIKPKIVDKSTHKNITIFDLIKPSVALFIPGYNEPTKIHEIYSRAFEKGGIKEYEKMIVKIHKLRVKVLKNILNQNNIWKIFMIWFDIADLFGHLYICKMPEKIRKVYIDLNKLISEIKDKVPKETLFLIVSDHGIRASPNNLIGEHTNYAFYSFNMNVMRRPHSIYDFYFNIRELLVSDNKG